MEETGEPKADILVLIEVTVNSCLILLSQRRGLVSKGSGVDDPMAPGELYSAGCSPPLLQWTPGRRFHVQMSL